jgi:hypothetical protein
MPNAGSVEELDACFVVEDSAGQKMRLNHVRQQNILYPINFVGNGKYAPKQ